jgi:hypothetical protein
MQWGEDLLARTQRALFASLRSIDWPLIAVIAGFLVALPIGGMVGGAIIAPLLEVSRLFVADPFAPYDDALAASALKRPSYQRGLLTIDPKSATVSVFSFGPRRPPILSNRPFDMWVSTGTELRDACTGKADPVRTLEEILGLPPTAVVDPVVTEFSVPRESLFRPCMSGDDVGAAKCGFDLPSPPKADADPATLRDAYQQLRFVAAQMWSSYRMGFSRSGASASDYPYTGFPFTGMGWTYNWSKSSPDHVGVSEFVIKRDAVISVVGNPKTPAEFCTKPS